MQLIDLEDFLNLRWHIQCNWYLSPFSDRLNQLAKLKLDEKPSKNVRIGKFIKAEEEGMAKTGISKNATAKMKKIAGKKELKEDKVRVTEKNATMLNSRILKDTVNRLKRCCVEKETTIQEFLNRIILERLEEEGF